MTHGGIIAQFADAMRARSIIPPNDLRADGKLHRCDAAGRHGKDDAAYVLHLDGIAAGGFQNWRDGLDWQDWCAAIDRELTDVERKTCRQRMEAARAQRDADERHRRADAAKRAADIWRNAATTCNGFPYLSAKHLGDAHGARLYHDKLVVPVRDIDGTLHSLQFIDASGGKRFLTGGRKREGCCVLGEIIDANVIVIAEGFATVATLHEATDFPVIAAFDAGNLPPVAVAVRRRFPAAKIVVAADDDHGTVGNPGVTKAREAAALVAGVVAIPNFGPDRPSNFTDFNDLGHFAGHARVREIIDAALAEASPSRFGEWDAGTANYDDIPPRGWLLGNTFCRGFVSGLISEGAGGKTALRLVQCLAVATGRPFTGEHVFVRGRVLLLVLEDGRAEILRRLRAAMLHHDIVADDIRGQLFVATLESFGAKLATVINGQIETGALKADIEAVISQRKIDLVVIDPLKKAHGVNENDNNQMDFVVAMLAEMAINHDCAVDTPYHASKGGPSPGNADKGRGASAYKDGGRLIYTLSPMLNADAERFGVDEHERRLLRRLDDAKNNLSPPGDTQWFRLVNVAIGNATATYPNGDHVQTVEPWVPPATWGGASYATLNAILTEIDQGLPDGSLYSNQPKVGDRAAHLVVQRHLPDKTEGQAREIIRTWIKNGVLLSVDYQDPATRKTRKGLRLDPTKRPG
jgi:phage/plasmid primase-like uncharacterized protein